MLWWLGSVQGPDSVPTHPMWPQILQKLWVQPGPLPAILGWPRSPNTGLNSTTYSDVLICRPNWPRITWILDLFGGVKNAPLSLQNEKRTLNRGMLFHWMEASSPGNTPHTPSCPQGGQLAPDFPPPWTPEQGTVSISTFQTPQKTLTLWTLHLSQGSPILVPIWEPTKSWI